ncbi:hypothetical protein F8S09_12960 [Deinococcus sp. SDU3-2]|uniref:Uncharacterized protein n=1 Tax=Deinococcus terrestris TaxID=2651870 RepID=A0A7X1TS97_9DEIO|nr:hypothetical protein [Deinococcus terrestris]MPY67585.1 hypothetical protein [Deinococcus terrestris]
MSADVRILRLAAELLTLDHWAAGILGERGEKDRSGTLPAPRQLTGHLMSPRVSDRDLESLRKVCARGLTLYSLWHGTPLLTREGLEAEVLVELQDTLVEAEQHWHDLHGAIRTLEGHLEALRSQAQAAD